MYTQLVKLNGLALFEE